MSADTPHGPEIELDRLVPKPGTITVGALLSGLNLTGKALVERPYVLANFVATADGRATFEGRSGGLSNSGDRAMFHGLREHVDAILAGTGTLRTERYGRLVRDAERRRRRARSGLSPEPLACVITRSGEVPTDIPLFREPAARIVVFTPTPLDLSRCGAAVDVVALDPGELTLTTVMRRLRSRYHVRTLLCEGGPTLFGALLREDLVDELFLTLSPTLAGGGTSPTIASGAPLADLRPLGLVWALEREGALYLRYALNRS